LSEEFVRAVWGYYTSLSASQGRQSEKPTSIQPGDALSLLSCLSPSVAQELHKEWKEVRTKAKAVGFGFLYGMGAQNFVNYAFDEYDLVFTLEEAERVRNAFFNLYSGLRAWHASVEDFVRRHGYVMSPLGRIRRLPDVYSPDKSLQYEAIRQAINSPVQATASDFTLAAMVILHNQLKHNTKLDAQVVGQVHDSILVECNEKTADEVASLIKEVMEQRTPE